MDQDLSYAYLKYIIFNIDNYTSVTFLYGQTEVQGN